MTPPSITDTTHASQEKILFVSFLIQMNRKKLLVNSISGDLLGIPVKYDERDLGRQGQNITSLPRAHTWVVLTIKYELRYYNPIQ